MFVRERQALGRKPLLQSCESSLELSIGRLKSRLGIDLEMPPHVCQREQQITELLFLGCSIALLDRGSKLAQLLVHLCHQALSIRPVKSDPCHLGGDPRRLDESR